MLMTGHTSNILLIPDVGQSTETVSSGHPHMHVTNRNREENSNKPRIWHLVF